MEKMTRHPLRATEDALKRALILNGFSIADCGTNPEMEIASWGIPLFDEPDYLHCSPVLMEGGKYALRSELLASSLSGIKGQLPLKTFSVGRVFDAADKNHADKKRLEGIVALQEKLEIRHIKRMWQAIAKEAFGIQASVCVQPAEKNAYSITASVGDKEFPLAYIAHANALAKALLSAIPANAYVWIFAIDIDAVTMAVYDIESREVLYSPLVPYLKRIESTQPLMGDPYYTAAASALQELGFVEFSGQKVYEADCYKKMNMFQGAWDKNNKGVQLAEPLGELTGMPTVLTPALEEALAANYKAGVESAMLYEFGHIFMPQENEAPLEKISLSFGCYGPNMDNNTFRVLMDKFFTMVGFKNHFFIPIPGKAIAYNDACVFIVMNQYMQYQETNFGGISPKALENHGIGVSAWMAQLEFSNAIKPTLEKEFNFIPSEEL